jgi:hypothetical protein
MRYLFCALILFCSTAYSAQDRHIALIRQVQAGANTILIAQAQAC